MAGRRVRRGAAASGAALGATVLFAPTAGAEVFEVTKTEDTDDNECAIDDCSLREALYEANNYVGADEITFASSVTGTIDVGTALEVTDGVSIIGPGAGQLELDGGGSGAIFYVGKSPATIGEGEPVSISGLTLSNGSASLGGAVYAREAALTIADFVVTGNEAVSKGAGVYSKSGSWRSSARPSSRT